MSHKTFRAAHLAALVFLAGGLIAGGAHAADCSYPPDSYIIPNGASDSKEDMLEAKRSVQDYVAKMQEYIDCLAADIDAADEEVSPQRVEMQVKRHDAAIDQMESVAARFNEQLRLYRERG